MPGADTGGGGPDPLLSAESYYGNYIKTVRGVYIETRRGDTHDLLGGG